MTALSLHSSNETLRRVLASVNEAPERLQAFLETESDPLIAFTAQREILAANEAAERFFGYSRHELDAQRTDLLVPKRLRQPEAPPQVATTDLASVELPGLRKDGTEVEIVWTFGSVPSPAGPIFVLVARDRTRLLAEVESLQRSAAREQDLERQLRSVYENALDGFLIVDDEMRIADANPAACRLLRRSREQLVSMSTNDLLLAGEGERSSSLMSDLRAAGSIRGEGEILLPDGTRRCAEFSAVANISPGRHLSIFRDVEDRRRAAHAQLHASEERFHQLVNAIDEYAIFILDPTGLVTTWNPGVEKIKGYTRVEIIGKHFSVFYTPEDRAAGRPAKILEAVRREGRFEDESWRVRKDGSRFWANVVISALRNPNGEITGLAKITRDLTERRTAEEKDRQLALSELARSASEAERACSRRESRPSPASFP
jgi:PAS domain S-box-containing protein